MKLHLIRHGKTQQDSVTGKDFDRDLLPKGMKQSLQLGEYCSIPANAKVFVSTAKRAQNTFELFNRSHHLNNAEHRDDLYLCSRETMCQLIWDQDHHNDILIVGHNYGISDLASYFSDEDIELRTGEYIQLEFPFEYWSETSKGTATIVDRYRPVPAL